MTLKNETVLGVTIAFGDRGRKPNRRLADKMFAAFHQACDQDELELAGNILRLLEELVASRSFGQRVERRAIDELIAGYTRLWMLKHPEAEMAA